MNRDFADLQLRQLDTTLARWRHAELPARPTTGWINAIRVALGMPAAQLAKRLGVVASTVARLEHSEADDTISLATLRRAAAALDCELQYALVPRRTLAETLDARATELAQSRMGAVSHSMALEAQATSTGTVARQARSLANKLLQGSRRELWRQD